MFFKHFCDIGTWPVLEHLVKNDVVVNMTLEKGTKPSRDGQKPGCLAQHSKNLVNQKDTCESGHQFINHPV